MHNCMLENESEVTGFESFHLKVIGNLLCTLQVYVSKSSSVAGVSLSTPFSPCECI